MPMQTTISTTKYVSLQTYLNTLDFIVDPILNSINDRIKNTAVSQVSQIHNSVNNIRRPVHVYLDTQFK